MILYLANVIIAIILLFILIVTFSNSFPSDEKLRDKKNKKIEEINKTLKSVDASQKRKYFEELYKDSAAVESYFLDEWIDYTSQFSDFSEENKYYYETKFKETMYKNF